MNFLTEKILLILSVDFLCTSIIFMGAFGFCSFSTELYSKSKINPETNLREISTWKFLLVTLRCVGVAYI